MPCTRPPRPASSCRWVSCRDPHLGPLVVVAAGGVLVELLADRAVALPPLTRDRARATLDRLAIRALLDGWRGAGRPTSRRSSTWWSRVVPMAVDLGDRLDALDLNPVIVGPSGAIAVDVLVDPGLRPLSEN